VVSRIKSNLVQRAILLMEAHSLNQRTAVNEVAAKLGVSIRTLVRAFQKTFNLSHPRSCVRFEWRMDVGNF